MNYKSFATTTLAVLTAVSFHINARADITTGLIGYWPFNENTGSSATDLSGNGDAGTLEFALPNSAWTPSSEPANGGASAIVFNQGGVTTNYVSIANGGSALWKYGGTPNFTFAAWVNPSVAGSSQNNPAEIVIKGAQASPITGNESAVGLDISGGSFRFQYHNSTNNAVTVSANTTINAGTWYHVVGVYNRNSITPNNYMAIYINGVSNATSASTFRTDVGTNNNPVTIGNGLATGSATTYADYFQGTIDDVRIYNRALSPSDVFQLYTNTLTSAPVITTQPRNVTCYFGDSPAFGATVNVGVSLQPLSYQWQFNGTNIAGATSSVLVVTNAQAANVGTYTEIVSNVIGTVVCSNANLTLNSLPTANFLAGQVGFWKFDDGIFSSTAADSTVNADTGTLSGFADTSYANMWTSGLAGGALNFNVDGSGSNVVAIPSVGAAAPAVLDFSATGATGKPVFTLAAWVNAGSVQTNGGAIIAKGTGGGGEQYVVDVSGGHYRFYVRDTNGAVFTAQTAVAPNGLWQHVAAVLNATNGIMNCYVSGQLAGEGVAPFSLLSNTHEMSIGNRQASTTSYGLAFTGVLDEVRVYNRDLTSADVLALYRLNPTPIVVGTLPANLTLVSGVNAQLPVTASGGLPPLSYQWRHNSVNISGATTSVLNFTNPGSTAAGSYDVVVSDSGIVPSATSSVTSVAIVPDLTFNTNGSGWTLQGGTVTWPANNTLQLTASTGSEANSAFYFEPLYVGGFQASYNYKCVTGASGSADGISFCVQNDPRGATARGGGGGQMGLGIPNQITPSVDLEFNIYAGNGLGGVGISLSTNGIIGQVSSTAPVVINNGDTINTVFNYQNGVAKITLTDTNTGAHFSVTNNLNIPAILGTNIAYIGFTGGDGGSKSTQQVSSFTYVSLVGMNIQSSGNTTVLSWPLNVGGYVLKKNSSLATTNWVTVTNAVAQVNGQNQVSIPRTNSVQFYRLALP